jgi:hypothetical protein
LAKTGGRLPRNTADAKKTSQTQRSFSHLTKCPITNPSCNNHPKTAQNCQRKRKKYEFLPKNHKKCALFTQKYKKIPIFHHFFVANNPQIHHFASNQKTQSQ